jgi:hypothetical protein
VTGWRLGLPEHTAPAVAVGSSLFVGAAVYGLMAILLMRPDLFRARETLLRMRG